MQYANPFPHVLLPYVSRGLTVAHEATDALSLTSGDVTVYDDVLVFLNKHK